MNEITIFSPGKLVFGNESLKNLASEVNLLGAKRVLVITFNEIRNVIAPVIAEIEASGIRIEVDYSIVNEPTVTDFTKLLEVATAFNPDVVIGIGGGSILDVSKLIAALIDNVQSVYDVFGINVLQSRSKKLICVPTTSGTGSEMSPNAILLDEKENLKKGIISPYLVADITIIDPSLTLTVPSAITASTGIDAFTHCLEAYVNKFAHPVVDTFALDGMKLIFHNLKEAVENGDNLDARAAVAQGSMYGGMCLGPVNTTAIHALSYPLGSEYHIPHGLSNALLLPAVMEFNMQVSWQRYANIARLLGINGVDDKLAAQKLIEQVKMWMAELNIPAGISEINIPEDAIPDMAKAAITVQRLLKNNPREVSIEDAVSIYKNAY